MQIKVVNFNYEAPLLGTSMVPYRSLSQGQKFESGHVEITPYNEIFIKLNYVMRVAERSYCQLVPWARVDTILYAEDEVTPADFEPEVTTDGTAAPKRRGRPRKDS